jgi:hypothetical protein
LGTRGFIRDQFMPTWARHKNQAGSGKEQIAPIGALQSDTARLQQMKMAARVGAIVRRHAAQSAIVKQPCTDAEL